jgi:hypothetical protein
VHENGCGVGSFGKAFTAPLCKPSGTFFRRCDTKPAATPFAATPYLTELPGRPNPKYNTSLYCFTLMTVQPSDRTVSADGRLREGDACAGGSSSYGEFHRGLELLISASASASASRTQLTGAVKVQNLNAAHHHRV